MHSSDESGGSKILNNWRANVTVIQLHLALADLGVDFTMNGTISELGSGSLHLVGAGHVGGIGADCEAIIDFEEESLEVPSENTAQIPLKNENTVSLSATRKPIPE